MTLNWAEIPEKEMIHFKGGEGSTFAKVWADDTIRLMLGRLPVGSTIGEHVHVTNHETCYIVSGTARFFIDDVPEVVPAGMTHHCPQGRRHRCENAGETDLVMMCVIPEVGEQA